MLVELTEIDAEVVNGGCYCVCEVRNWGPGDSDNIMECPVVNVINVGYAEDYAVCTAECEKLGALVRSCN